MADLSYHPDIGFLADLLLDDKVDTLILVSE